MGFLVKRAYQRTVPVPLRKRRTIPTYRTSLPLQKKNVTYQRTVLFSKN